AISSFTCNLRRFNSASFSPSVDGWARASLISSSSAWWRRSSSARCAWMDMWHVSSSRLNRGSLHQNRGRFDARFGCAVQQSPDCTARQAASLNIAVQNGISSRVGPRLRITGLPRTSGGDDQRGRTRVAGATGAVAAGAPRPRRRDLGLAGDARLRPAAGAAPQKAQALPARPYFLYRGPAYARHHRVRRARLFRLNPGLPDHGGPARGLFGDQLAHVLGTAAGGEQVELGEPLLGLGVVDDV